MAACWLTLSLEERFAYTANAGSGSLSGFSVAPDGTLHLLNPGGIAAVIGVGSHPVDMAVSRDGRFLFYLANGNGTLNSFRVTSIQRKSAFTACVASRDGHELLPSCAFACLSQGECSVRAPN